ncbi:hypothetical protein AA313_de0209107 [Arthrobotrys entomopaga]|nr:hypothetical protein AA313_de0209107 [Arthrobotrys entomopaga]
MAWYSGTQRCSRNGSNPTVVAYFYQDTDRDTLQYADWEEIARATDSYWPYGSWEEIKPNTTAWAKNVEKYKLQPGQILFDAAWGYGDSLRVVDSKLARVRRWDISKLGYRFNEEPWVLKNDVVMSKLERGDISQQEWSRIKDETIRQRQESLPSSILLWDDIINREEAPYIENVQLSATNYGGPYSAVYGEAQDGTHE